MGTSVAGNTEKELVARKITEEKREMVAKGKQYLSERGALEKYRR